MRKPFAKAQNAKSFYPFSRATSTNASEMAVKPRSKLETVMISPFSKSSQPASAAGAAFSFYLFLTVLLLLHLFHEVVVFGHNAVPILHLVVEFFHEIIALRNEVRDGVVLFSNVGVGFL
jgi:hypothetical protein